MDGQFLEGQKLMVQLPLDKQAALGAQSPRSPQQQQQQRRLRDYSVYVDGLPPDSTDQSVADLFRWVQWLVGHVAVQQSKGAGMASMQLSSV